MKTIAQVISNKGDQVESIKPNTHAVEAIKTMALKGISSLLIIDKGEVVGIFCEKDFSCKVVVENRLSENVPVSEVMTTPVCAIRPEQSVSDGMSIMTEKRIRHLPVMDGKQLVGLVSIGDLVKAIIKEQQDTIEQLEHYIHY
ncbi:MAG: CBS domain-containing protein [Cocleimonas sp.]